MEFNPLVIPIGIGLTVLLIILIRDQWVRWGCRLVGHQPPVYAAKGWYSPGEEYGRVRGSGVDGINRRHACVYAECARCGKEFRVVRIHLPKSD